MSKQQPQDKQPEATQEGAAEDQAPAEKPKLSPLEAIKARQAAMRSSKGGQGQHADSGGAGAGTGGPTKKPNLQRKMGG